MLKDPLLHDIIHLRNLCGNWNNLIKGMKVTLFHNELIPLLKTWFPNSYIKTSFNFSGLACLLIRLTTTRFITLTNDSGSYFGCPSVGLIQDLLMVDSDKCPPTFSNCYCCFLLKQVHFSQEIVWSRFLRLFHFRGFDRTTRTTLDPSQHQSYTALKKPYKAVSSWWGQTKKMCVSGYRPSLSLGHRPWFFQYHFWYFTIDSSRRKCFQFQLYFCCNLY